MGEAQALEVRAGIGGLWGATVREVRIKMGEAQGVVGAQRNALDPAQRGGREKRTQERLLVESTSELRQEQKWKRGRN